MKLFNFWKKSSKPKIIYKAKVKLTRLQRRDLRRFLRSNGIVGAIITNVYIPEMNGPQISEGELYYLYSSGKLKQA